MQWQPPPLELFQNSSDLLSSSVPINRNWIFFFLQSLTHSASILWIWWPCQVETFQWNLMTNKIVQYWVTNLMVSSLCMITKRLTRCLDESIFINGTGYKTSNDEQVNCQFNTCIIFVRMNLTYTKSKLNCFFFLQSLTLTALIVKWKLFNET